MNCILCGKEMIGNLQKDYYCYNIDNGYHYACFTFNYINIIEHFNTRLNGKWLHIGYHNKGTIINLDDKRLFIFSADWYKPKNLQDFNKLVSKIEKLILLK